MGSVVSKMNLTTSSYFFLLFGLVIVLAKDEKKKDIRDYNDHDLEKLLEQWEEDEEPLPVDELPEWDPRKPQPQVDINDPDLLKDPEALLQATKKGKTIMVFVKVKGN